MTKIQNKVKLFIFKGILLHKPSVKEQTLEKDLQKLIRLW